MKKKPLHYVLLGDVVDSRGIEDRATFEKKFSHTITSLNKRFSKALVLPIRGWKGLDEIAAVANDKKILFTLADAFNAALAPQKLRLVVVQAPLDVLPKDGDVTKADGPGFHRAAAAMLQLKKEGLLFEIQSGDDEKDALLKLQVNLFLMLKGMWTEKQHQVYAAWCRNSSQEGVAKELGITQQNVSKTLIGIKAAQVQALEKSLQQWLDAQF